MERGRREGYDPSPTDPFISLSHTDASRLAEFRCATTDQPWSARVETGIHEAGEFLKRASWNALAIEGSGKLYAVAIWEDRGEQWLVDIIATASNHREEGHAKRLIQEVILRAYRAGAEFVRWEVDLENHAMMHLVRNLPAVSYRADYVRKVWYCAASLRPRR